MLQNDTWYIILDGLAVVADDEPHFIPKPKEDNGPEIPEADEEALEEIEAAIDDGEPVTDIGKALKDNAGKVKGVVDKIAGKGKDGAVEEAPEPPKPENMATMTAAPQGPCSSYPEEIEEVWGVAQGLLLEDDFVEDSLSIVFFNIVAEFEVPENEDEEGSEMSFAAKLVQDDVEQLDTRYKVGNFAHF